jgi:hypothetical protein
LNTSAFADPSINGDNAKYEYIKERSLSLVEYLSNIGVKNPNKRMEN